MRLRILLSYWYYKDADLDDLFAKYFTEPYPEVFADSGGFSAMTQGAKISTGEYAAWVKRWVHLFTTYANLDEIGDAVGTLRNQEQLEAAGLTPLPVFHTGESWDYLERYIEQYPYIALGGMVPYMRFPKKIMPWTTKAFKIAGGRAVFHGFGATAWVVMSSFPWYSVDSSSWGQGFRFGQIPVFDEKRGGFLKANLGDPVSFGKVAPIVREMGFEPADFYDRKRNDRAKVCAISALSYIRAERWLRRRWGEIHIPGRDGAGVGLRQHLADANPARFGEAASGLRLHLADTGGLKENYRMADSGVKLHLADARASSGGDLAAAQTGLKLHLAEHSMDRGG